MGINRGTWSCKTWWRTGVAVGVGALLALGASAASAAQVTINPIMDNTIAQGIDPDSGENFEDNSSGACDSVFSGTTADNLLRRTLVQFEGQMHRPRPCSSDHRITAHGGGFMVQCLPE